MKSKGNVLLVIVLASILLKLPYVNNPISDWHSWNQISTMATARYIVQEGVDAILHTRVDLFESFQDRSNATFAEFPLLSGLIAIGFAIVHAEPEWLARLICILFSALGSVYFFLLVAEETNEKTACIATALYLIAPMVWYFHRTVMTDVVMVNFVTAALYHFRYWARYQKYSSFLFAVFFTAFAALAKAYALYIGIAFLLLLLEYQGWRKLLRLSNFIFFIGSVAPIAIWIWHCSAGVSAGSSGSNLTASAELIGPISIWFSLDYWKTLASSVGDFTLLPIGSVFFLYTLLRCRKDLRKTRVAIYWLAAVLFYFLFVRQGNSEHDYYQMPFAAPVVFIAAIGWHRWFGWLKMRISPKHYAACVACLSILMILNAAKYTYSKARIDPSPVSLGEKLAEINMEKNHVLIVDPDRLQRNQALYYAKSHGWHIRHLPNREELQTYKNYGCSYLGINYKSDRLKDEQAIIAEYRPHLKKIWESYSIDRYRNRKTLLIYKL